MSATCPECSLPLDRQRRTSIERVLYRRLWVCRSCGARVHVWRIPFEATWAFVSTRHTSCIMCGNTRVRRIPVRDRIDAMSAHPLSMLFGLMGAPIYHCNACRHQYRDWRSLAPVTEPTADGARESDAPEFLAPSHANTASVNESAPLLADAALQQRSDG